MACMLSKGVSECQCFSQLTSVPSVTHKLCALLENAAVAKVSLGLGSTVLKVQYIMISRLQYLKPI